MSPDKEKVRESVRERYSRRVASSGCCSDGSACCSTSSSCCSTSCDCTPAREDGLVGPALGCGSPLDMVRLTDGMDVLDIGSGAGREALEAARRVGPSGTVFGLDMNDDMLRLARENKRRTGVTNVFFLRGVMEEVPLPAESVDLVISNCVINLSSDKDRAVSEIFRVLKGGGRLGVSDTVVDGRVTEAARENMDLWCSCVSGSMEPDEYAERLRRAGFVDVSVQVKSWYGEVDELGKGVRLGSAFISATKPA